MKALCKVGFILVITAFLMIGCNKQTVKQPEPFSEYEEVGMQAVQEQSGAETMETSPAPKPRRPERLATIYFSYDKYELTPEARAMLSMHARKLQEFSDMRIRIEGHCDERGTIEYNLALGEKRANVVKTYLVNYGVDPSRISTISYGKERPADPGHSESAWAKNRRAQFIITQ